MAVTEMFPVEQKSFLLGYCMGLLVGEGSLSGDLLHPAISMNLHAKDPKPLLCLKKHFGGKIYGPYLHQGRHYRKWILRGDELIAAVPKLIELLPASNKRTQLWEWRRKWKTNLCKNRKKP